MYLFSESEKARLGEYLLYLQFTKKQNLQRASSLLHIQLVNDTVLQIKKMYGHKFTTVSKKEYQNIGSFLEGACGPVQVKV